MRTRCCAQVAAAMAMTGIALGGCKRTRADSLSPNEIVLANPRDVAVAPPPEPPAAPRLPTSPDPLAGNFTLDQAMAGLPGHGAPIAMIHTDIGNVRCRFFADKAPRLVANFIGLARGVRPFWDAGHSSWVRRPFYAGLTFHRVIPNFMIQGGDPLGVGRGGPGYNMPYEAEAEVPFDRAGILAPAKAGDQREFVSGSQFFITDGPAPHLTGQFPAFGMCEPVSVVAHIARVPQNAIAGNRPLTPVHITLVQVFHEDAPPLPPQPPSLPPATKTKRILPPFKRPSGR